MAGVEWSTTFFYFLLIICVTVLLIPIRANKILILIIWTLSFILALLPAAFRYGIGTDYFSYIDIYYSGNFINKGFFELINSREPAFQLLNYCVERVFNHPQFVFVFSALILLLFTYIFIYSQKKYISTWLAILVFMTLFYFSSYNIIRQFISIGIVIYSLKHYLEKNTIKFVILICFASLFHLTALIMIPIYLTIGLSKSKKLMTVLCVGFIIGVFLFYEQFLARLTSYELFEQYGRYESESTFGVGQIIIRLPILLPLLIYKNEIMKINKKYESLIYLIIIELFLSLASYVTPYIDRLALYFFIAYIPLLAILPKVFKKPYSYYVSFYIVGYCLIYWFYFYVYNNSGETIPYQSILGL